MKIEHLPGKNTIRFVSNGSYVFADRNEIPHECSAPNCPGNLNRQKLELFEEMLEALEIIASNSHQAANGGLKELGKSESVRVHKDVHRRIREIATAAISKAKELK